MDATAALDAARLALAGARNAPDGEDGDDIELRALRDLADAFEVLDAGWLAQTGAVIAAASALLARLDHITTESFAHGGEHAEREALRTALGLSEDQPVPAGTIDMDAVVAELRRRGYDARVEQTGGNVATIYANSREYRVLAGPGWFEGPGWTKGRAAAEGFFIGPEDDGESETVSPEYPATSHVADLIQATFTRLARHTKERPDD